MYKLKMKPFFTLVIDKINANAENLLNKVDMTTPYYNIDETASGTIDSTLNTIIQTLHLEQCFIDTNNNNESEANGD